MLVGDTNGDGVIDYKDVANTLRRSRMAGAYGVGGMYGGYGGYGGYGRYGAGLGLGAYGVGGYRGYGLNRFTPQVKNMGGVLVGDTNGDGVVDGKDLVNTLAGRGAGVGYGAGWGGYGAGYGGYGAGRWGGYGAGAYGAGAWGRGSWAGRYGGVGYPYAGYGVNRRVANVGGMLVGDTNGDGVIDYKDVANTLRASRMAGVYGGYPGVGYGAGLGYGAGWNRWGRGYPVSALSPRVGVVNGVVTGDTNGDGVIDSTDVTNTVIARAKALL